MHECLFLSGKAITAIEPQVATAAETALLCNGQSGHTVKAKPSSTDFDL